MKKNPRKTKWTKAFRKTAGKELVLDSTFEFEKRRHRPVKYDREKMAITLRAMKKVAEVREKRERAFIKKRLSVRKQVEKLANIKELKENIDIIKPVAARVREQVLLNASERMVDS